MNDLILKYVEQFIYVNEYAPYRIVCTPLAALTLGVKKEISVEVCGIPVVIEEFDEEDAVLKCGRAMGLFYKIEGDTHTIRAITLAK